MPLAWGVFVRDPRGRQISCEPHVRAAVPDGEGVSLNFGYVPSIAADRYSPRGLRRSRPPRSARPTQPDSRDRGFDGVSEVFDRPAARHEFGGSEHRDVLVVGLGEHNRDIAPGRESSVDGLIIAMVEVELDRKPYTERLPGGALADEPVGDVAQRAVGSAEPSANEVGQLAADGSVGVVYAYEASDRPVHVVFIGHAIHATGAGRRHRHEEASCRRRTSDRRCSGRPRLGRG